MNEATTPTASPAENILSAIGECLDRSSAEALLRLRAAEEMQARIEWLAEGNSEERLSDDERDEYESLVRLGNFVAILQMRARQRLSKGKAA